MHVLSNNFKVFFIFMYYDHINDPLSLKDF